MEPTQEWLFSPALNSARTAPVGVETNRLLADNRKEKTMKIKCGLGITVIVLAIMSIAGTAVAKDKIVIGQAIALSGPMAGGVAIDRKSVV